MYCIGRSTSVAGKRRRGLVKLAQAHRNHLLLGAAAISASVTWAPATTFQFTNKSGGSFEDPNNYSVLVSTNSDTYPMTGDTANFSTGATAAYNVTLGTEDVTNINFTDSFTTNLSGGSLTLDSGGSITKTNNSNYGEVNSTLTFAGGTSGVANLYAFGSGSLGGVNRDNQVLQLNGVLTGSGTIDIGKVGYANTTIFNNSNTSLSGTINVNYGYLYGGGATSFGSTSIFLAGGTVLWLGSNTTTPTANAITVNAGSTAATLSSYSSTIVSGPVAIATGGIFNVSGGGNQITFSGVISGGGNFNLIPNNGNSQGFNISGASSNMLTGTITDTAPAIFSLLKTGGATAIAGGLTVQNVSTGAVSVQLFGNNEIASTTTPFLNGGATYLNLNTYSQTLAGITGTGTVRNNNSSTGLVSTLTLSTALSTSTSFSGILANGSTGALALTISGSGTQSLSGANTYSGATNITGGTLRANTLGPANSSTGTGAVTVGASGKLGGVGYVAGTVAVSGTITAGVDDNTTGTLNTGAQTWNAGANYLAKVNTGTVSGTSGDTLVMSGLTISSTTGSPFTVNLTGLGGGSTFSSSATQLLIAVDTNTGQTGVFQSQISSGALTLATTNVSPSSSGLMLAEVDSTGGTYAAGDEELVVEESTAAAPEPTSLLLLGAVGSPLLLSRRKRSKSVSGVGLS